MGDVHQQVGRLQGLLQQLFGDALPTGNENVKGLMADVHDVLLAALQTDDEKLQDLLLRNAVVVVVDELGGLESLREGGRGDGARKAGGGK